MGKKSVRRMTAAVLAALLLAAAGLSGCSGKDAQNGTAKTDGTAQAGPAGETQAESTAGTEALGGTFSYLMHSKFVTWLNDLEWYTYVPEKTGVTVEFVEGPSENDDYYSDVDQRMISKSFPDAGIVKLAQANVYGEQGAFVDLKPYIEQYAPNIQKYLEDHPGYAALVTSENGAIYGLANETPTSADVVAYRTDHFKEAGIEKIPGTIDEFTEAMRTLKAYYGAKDSNYYPLSGRDQLLRFMPYFEASAGFEGGTAHGNYYTSSAYGYDLKAEGFKQMVEWYHTLYAEGLIDPEWVSGAISEEQWETSVLTGKSSIFTDGYTRPAWFMNNSDKTTYPEYDLNVIPYMKTVNGNTTKMTAKLQYDERRCMAINITAEDKAPMIMKYLDFFFSEEGQTLANWGVEGVSYEVADGRKQYLVDYTQEEQKPAGTKKWSFLTDQLTFIKPIDNEAFYSYNTEFTTDIALSLFTEDNLAQRWNIIYSTDQTKEISNLVSIVNESMNSGVLKFIKGERSMDEWDAFLAEMDGLGYDRIVEIEQEAYDAMYK
ncbi:extracellular solute-binding protein [Lachnotalea sp. AF33-28]|uniref:extracellular solute-binding protein n=1 Tax=Lachnotalea sp. AF33-28 TaxID=2292046 RepID=UPI000E528F00|nr:extracellular solute-binding protein [Lachnotalea sp. AF33-28]RHP35080.1 hypothetical protein DWZ56_06125 [Lachnotalea sp. AF33-28]